MFGTLLEKILVALTVVFDQRGRVFCDFPNGIFFALVVPGVVVELALSVGTITGGMVAGFSGLVSAAVLLLFSLSFSNSEVMLVRSGPLVDESPLFLELVVALLSIVGLLLKHSHAFLGFFGLPFDFGCSRLSLLNLALG